MSDTRVEIEALAVRAETRQQLFERLLRPHLRRLYRLAFHLTRRTVDAQDLLQDVLVKLFERADELSSIADLRPWTNRVLYNLFVDQRRRSRRSRLALVSVDADESGDALDAAAVQNLQSSARGPAADAALASDIRRLDQALATLSDEHRLVVMLHDAEDCTLEEIAAMTDIPLGTVKSRLHRARQRLRELTDDGTFSP